MADPTTRGWSLRAR